MLKERLTSLDDKEKKSQTERNRMEERVHLLEAEKNKATTEVCGCGCVFQIERGVCMCVGVCG